MTLNLKKVHEDERGQIYLIQGPELKQHQEITLFVTKEKFARGGCVHNIHDEHCVVLEGAVEYHIRTAKIKVTIGKTEEIPKSAPHYFISLTDSIVLEWGADPTEKVNKDPKYRQIVEDINAKR